MTENKYAHLTKITSEKEYCIQHKIYSRKLTHLSKKVKLFFNNPKEYINLFENIIKEMLYVGVINEEQATTYRTKLYTEMSNPKIKQKLKSKLQKLKSKLTFKK